MAFDENYPDVFYIRAFTWSNGDASSGCWTYYAHTADEAYKLQQYLVFWHHYQGKNVYVIDYRVWFNNNGNFCLPGNYIWHPDGEPPPASPGCLGLPCNGLG